MFVKITALYKLMKYTSSTRYSLVTIFTVPRSNEIGCIFQTYFQSSLVQFITLHLLILEKIWE